MKAKWKFIVEGESAGAGEAKWLLLILVAIILVSILTRLGPDIVVHLWSHSGLLPR